MTGHLTEADVNIDLAERAEPRWSIADYNRKFLEQFRIATGGTATLPLLHADGVTDDTEALQAMVEGKPVFCLTTGRVLTAPDYSASEGGEDDD